jgi:hypothetical protein
MSKTANTAAVVEILKGIGLASLNEELAAIGLKPAEEIEVAATLVAMKVKSLDDFAVVVVNGNKGSVSGEELGTAMAKAFPAHKIGERHGPHYLSLCRTGSHNSDLVVRYPVGKSARKAATRTAKTDLSGVPADRLEAMLASVEGTPLATLIRAEINKRAAAPAPEAPKAPEPKAPEPKPETKAERDARIKAERLARRAERDAAAKEAANG